MLRWLFGKKPSATVTPTTPTSQTAPIPVAPTLQQRPLPPESSFAAELHRTAVDANVAQQRTELEAEQQQNRQRHAAEKTRLIQRVHLLMEIERYVSQPDFIEELKTVLKKAVIQNTSLTKWDATEFFEDRFLKLGYIRKDRRDRNGFLSNEYEREQAIERTIETLKPILSKLHIHVSPEPHEFPESYTSFSSSGYNEKEYTTTRIESRPGITLSW